MRKYSIKEIKDLLKRVPKSPWHYCGEDDLDHWKIWSSDKKTGYVLVDEDSGVPPDPDFIEFVLNARAIIEDLITQL